MVYEMRCSGRLWWTWENKAERASIINLVQCVSLTLPEDGRMFANRAEV